MSLLTLKQLMEMKPGIFAQGTVSDNQAGVNMTNSNRLLRWIAVRGQIHDWAIYCSWADDTEQWIRAHGDKVHDAENIKKLVPCDDAAFGMYRH